MSGKIKIAVSWAAACGGCDVSLLDIEEKILTLTEIADIVYWPVALDHKREDLLALPENSVDIGIFNGAVRTDEQEEDALAFREKCKVLVSFGSCASHGGVPGLANLFTRSSILDTAYESTPSTDNPDNVRPTASFPVNGHSLELPELDEVVRSLAQVVPVDLTVPGCPPPTERILDLVAAVAAYASDGSVPPAGTVLAADTALCDECVRRDSRRGGRIREFVRPHLVTADPDRCFLEQGILCMGMVTRGGCGATCLSVNMPCRGCFGPPPGQLDPGAEALSAIGSVAGEANENDVPAHEMKKAVRSIKDPAGTFYRFTLPSAILNRVVTDRPVED